MRHLSTRFLFYSILIILTACSGAPKKIVKKPIVDPNLSKPVLSPAHKIEFDQAVELIKADEFRQAQAQFNKLLKAYPRLAGAHVNLGIIEQKQNNDDLAIEHYENALRINPANADALLQMGTMYMRLGRFIEAEQKLLEAEVVNENTPAVQFNLGVLYELYLQNYDGAIHHYERYTELDHGDDVETVKRWIKLLERK